jgi:acetyltransferase-like isoleucine patch superfamily enzyme
MVRFAEILSILRNMATRSFFSAVYDLIHEFIFENVLPRRAMHTEGKVSVSSTARILHANNIYIGEKTNVNRYCCLWASPNARIVIGNNCLTGSHVTIITSKYRTDGKGNFRLNASTEEDVIIEDDVWLGSNVVVLPGVKIGRGSVIGAGTVVMKDVPPFSIVVGQKMRVLRSRE